jgi:hypothetical protein
MSQGKPPKPGTVLSQADNQPRIKPPVQSKAAKFFQSATRPQTTVSHLPVGGGRPPRPLVQDVLAYHADDPLCRIEASATRITRIVDTYETEREDATMRNLQELDSAYQLADAGPADILRDAKSRVDSLMAESRENREHQSDVLGSLYTWMRREQSVLTDMRSTSGPLRADLTSGTCTTSSTQQRAHCRTVSIGRWGCTQI